MRELKCLRCGTMMDFKGVKEFQMGHEGILGDTHFWKGSIEFELYECPECGKAELYKPKSAEHKNESEVVEVKAPKAKWSAMRR